MVAWKDSVLLKSFAPLKIKFSLEGGYILNYRIENKEAFTYMRKLKSRYQSFGKNILLVVKVR